MSAPSGPDGGDPACWAHLVAGERLDIATRAEVELLVRTFYRAAAADDRLGSLVTAAAIDRPNQVQTVTAFWMDHLFATTDDTRHCVVVREPFASTIDLRSEDAARWLALFTETVDELFAGPVAELAKARAATMAPALARAAR